jgi:hypothetical protein
MLNIQEIFDTVTTHLLTQRAKSAVPNTDGEKYGESKLTCLYRHPDGLTCAVGCLIKDEFYETRLEGLRATSDDVLRSLTDSGVDTESYGVRSLLRELQGVHDNEPVEDWDLKLSKIQSEFKLYKPEILREALKTRPKLDKKQRAKV